MIKLKIKDSKTPVKEDAPKRPKIKIKSTKSEVPVSARTSTVKAVPSLTSTSASSTKIKLVKKTPKIKLKAKRIPGDGYDSEDPDKEDDPLIEEGMVLRMLPDESLDNLKYMLETGDLSDLSIKWKDSKRAIISIRGVLYGAKLVDLPTITEVSKTIDKKNIFKTVDVCQMLLVVKKLQNEKEINDIKVYEYESYPNGLTKPLADVKNRFTKRINNLVINKVEARVEQLLKLDRELESSKYELIDFDNTPSTTTLNTPRAINEMDMANFSSMNDQVTREMVMNDGDEEIGIDLDELGDEITDDLEQELAQALVADEEDDDEEEEDEDDDDDDDDEEEDDDDEEGGVRTKEVVGDDEGDNNLQHNEMIREEITELEATIRQKENDVAKATNPILRNRFTDIVNRLKQELNIKKQQLKTGLKSSNTDNLEEEEDDDDEEEEDDDDEDEEEEDEDDEEDDDDDEEEESRGLFGEMTEGDINDEAAENDNNNNNNNEEDDDDMEGLF